MTANAPETAPSLHGAMTLSEILPPDLAAPLLATARTARYADGALIYSRGDRTSGLSIVKQGAVRVGSVDRDGVYAPILTLAKGHIFGEFTLFAGMPRAHDLVAVGPTILAHIEQRDFDAAADRSPEILRHFLRAVTVRFYHAIAMIDDVARLPLDVRAAKAIKTASVISGDGAAAPVRQVELAQSLGVSRVTIGKALHRLQAAGLVALRRGRIDIVDPLAFDAWIEARNVLGGL